MNRWIHLACVLALSTTFIPQARAEATAESAREYRQANEAEVLAAFAEFLRIPNVADDAENIRRNARYIQQAFAARGVSLDVLSVADAPPIVTGRIDVPGAERTLGIYVHYDGQPVDETRWTQWPWTPTLYSAAMGPRAGH